MARLTLHCVFLFISLGSSLADTSVRQETQWESYSSKGEEFTVLLPQPPTKITIFRPLTNPREKAKPVRMYGAYGDGVVYLILSFDNPSNKESLQVFIKELHQYPINAVAEVFEKELRLDGFSGKQFRFGPPRLSGVVQFYATKNHVYIVLATGEDMTKPGPNRFFASLRLSGNSGKEITYETSHKNVAPSTENLISGEIENVFTGKEVTHKARIVAKPPPSYTEEARQQQTTGTVVLRAVLASSGSVTGLRVLIPLPHRLTEEALIAARNIKFIPAKKDGTYVSMHIHLEYNFNLF